MSRHGQNGWYELMTTDLEAAKRFYGEALGWGTQAWEGGDPNNPYIMWAVGERPIGGLMLLPEEAKQAGAPPHWMAYTLVDDVDAICAKTEQLGGRINKAPFDIPQVGRIGILSDPQGAVFAVHKPESEMPPGPSDQVGDFGWAELNTTDYEAAWAFYSDLFGWKHRGSMEMGDAGTYLMFNDAAEHTKGGMSNVAKVGNLPPHWLYYVTVAEANEAADRIEQQGGKIMNGPMEIPGGGVIAQCLDPQGVAFAIYAGGKGS